MFAVIFDFYLRELGPVSIPQDIYSFKVNLVFWAKIRTVLSCCHESASSTLTVLTTGGPSSPQEISPPQRPLCIVGRLLCCGEAGEKEKESARGTMERGKREERRAMVSAVSLPWSCWKRVLHRSSSTSMFRCIVRKCWIIPAPLAKKLVTLASWKHFQQVLFPPCFALCKGRSERETASSSCPSI